MRRRIAGCLRSFHGNQRGDTVQYILIIALIALPIVIGLVVFRKEIGEIFGKKAKTVQTEGDKEFYK